MLHALTTQARRDREDGFTLIEILVAMVLMAIIMSSLAVFFIGSQKASAALRIRQNAAVIADTAMDQVHSVTVAKLLTGRDQTTSDAQWAAAVLGTTLVGVDTTQMNEVWDHTAASGTGALPLASGGPAISTVGQVTTVNDTPYTVNYVIGSCYVPVGGGDCTKVDPGQGILLDRVVVAVNWKDTGTACPNHACAYVVASLISPAGDPTFNVNQVLVDTTPPSTPSGLAYGSKTDVSVSNISWSASTDASGIGRYDVYRGTSPTFSDPSTVRVSTGTGTGTSWAGPDTGLIPGTQYYYFVIAYDTVGNASGPQVPVGQVTIPPTPFVLPVTTSADTFPPTKMAAPVASTPATNTSTSVTVTWAAGVDEYKVDHYLLYRNGSTTPITVPFPATSYTDTGLTPWTNYSYTIQAVDPAGNVSTMSNVSNVLQTKDVSPPSQVTGLAGAVDATVKTQLDLDWNDATDDVGVTSYSVCRSASPSMSSPTCAAVTGAPPTSAYKATGLASNTTYYFQVAALDAAGNVGTKSTVVAVSTPDSIAPTTPTNLTSTAKSATTVTLSWTAATDNIGVTSYQVLRNGTPVGTTTFPTVTYTDTGLTQLTSYVWSVKALDAAGNISAASPTYTASTLDGQPPTTPTLSNSTNGVTSTTLNWTVASDNVGVTGYALYRNGGTTPVATTSSTTYTFTDAGLSPNTPYTYTVKAFDAAGNYSTASSTVTATTLPDTVKPSTVLGLKGTSSAAKTVTISWNASTDNVAVISYKVYFNGALTTVASPGLSVYYAPLTAPSSNTVTVYAVDGAGNVSTVSATLTCTVTAGGTVTCS